MLGFQHPPPSYARPSLSQNTLTRRYIVTDSKALLRYALPLPSEREGGEEPVIRKVQAALENVAIDLRAKGLSGVRSARGDLSKAMTVLQEGQLDVLLDVRKDEKELGAKLIGDMEKAIQQMISELALPSDESRLPGQLAKFADFSSQGPSSKMYDRETVENWRTSALRYVTRLEEMMVEKETKFPFRIPRRYDELPRLLGRASVEIVVRKVDGHSFRDEDGGNLGSRSTFTAILDGYSAPLTAGNFIDLTNRHFYDDTRILSKEKGFYFQAGDKDGDGDTGFIDPEVRKRRNLPFEVFIEGDGAPLYGLTMESAGVGALQPVLPMTAFGAMSMLHSIDDDNDASSQFYVFMLDPRSASARSVGGTILNGNVATFGYITEGTKLLDQVEPGDLIESIKVIAGMNKFEPHAPHTS